MQCGFAAAPAAFHVSIEMEDFHVQIAATRIRARLCVRFAHPCLRPLCGRQSRLPAKLASDDPRVANEMSFPTAQLNSAN
jgi:hypothetical protein